MAAPAGTASEAVRYATKAAERARDQLAYEESVRLFTTALHAHELQPAAESEVRCDLLLALVMRRPGPATQVPRSRPSSGRQTSPAKRAGPTGSPWPRSGTAEGSSGSQITSAPTLWPHC